MSREISLHAAAAYLDDGRFFEALARRVAYKTESDQGFSPPALHAYLEDELSDSLSQLGFDCKTYSNPAPKGGPFLIARRIEDEALPTVLGYGHGDVVSGQEGKWRVGLEPWALREEGERWYGRGTADNKGQHSICISALQAVIEARGGVLGYNIIFLFETGEEAGSPGLHEFCATHKEQLRADVLIASDGPRVHATKPTLFLGSRGAINFSLKLKSRERAYHSGNWGGVIANPGTRIANAIATMVDANGVMLVKKLRPPAISEAIKRALANVEIGGDDDDPTLTKGWGEPGLSPAERLIAWNTIEVLAFGTGNPQRPINAIPSEGAAYLQLRFVVGTPADQLQNIVRKHLDEHGFDDIRVDVSMAGAATRLDVEHPWVRWAQRSMEASSGKPLTILPNLAGSLPNDAFSEILGLPTLWVPHSYPACSQHAPDEHLLPAVAREGLQIMAGLYWDLGEQNSAPWAARSSSKSIESAPQVSPKRTCEGPRPSGDRSSAAGTIPARRNDPDQQSAPQV
jgi:acetylornithine deacetylase/succinyl-diaminopimelate desuccinylase-like protein